MKLAPARLPGDASMQPDPEVSGGRAPSDITGLKPGATPRALAPGLPALLESIPHMVWCVDQHGRGLYYSRSWREFTGQDHAQSAFDAFEALVHPDDLEELRTAWSRRDASLECEH